MDVIDFIVGMAIAVDIRVFVYGFDFLSRIIFWFSLSVFVSTGQNKHPIPPYPMIFHYSWNHDVRSHVGARRDMPTKMQANEIPVIVAIKI